MDKNKLILPITILLGCIILGGAFYAVQASKQKSIEKQQTLKMEEDRRIADAKAEEDKKAAEAKAELDQKEFDAKRKSDCLAIYKTESDKWNNVRGWRYDDSEDTCYIRYKEGSPKTAAKCDELYPDKINDKPTLIFLRENSLCKDGEFENTF